MEKIYKGYFLGHLRKYINNKSLVFTSKEALENILETVVQKKWNVYAKASFGGPAQIIEYLGRYTHKVAITAHRVLHIDDSRISFKYKDYADGNKQKVMTLSHAEFLRRFEQHILPKSFVKIRHGGYLHTKNKMERIAAVCKQLKLPADTYSCSATADAANGQRYHHLSCVWEGTHEIGKNIYFS